MAEATLVILNPRAGSGRAEHLWAKVEPLAYEVWGNLVVAITERPQDVTQHLDKARAAGVRRVIAVGGDGTVHTIVNALVDLMAKTPHDPPMLFGQLPAGTGQDFARFLKIPAKLEDAVRWLSSVQPRPLDLGAVRYDQTDCHFLNIASIGISGEVDRRISTITNRRAWTYKLASLRSITRYSPPSLSIKIDGQAWYEGRAWLVVVANGRYFGKGMAIAPHAVVDDGLFEVVMVKEASRLRLLRAFNTVYSGKHLVLPEVMYTRAQRVEVESAGELLPLDLDGEYQTGHQFQFEVQTGALQMLYA